MSPHWQHGKIKVCSHPVLHAPERLTQSEAPTQGPKIWQPNMVTALSKIQICQLRCLTATVVMTLRL